MKKIRRLMFVSLALFLVLPTIMILFLFLGANVSSRNKASTTSNGNVALTAQEFIEKTGFSIKEEQANNALAFADRLMTRHGFSIEAVAGVLAVAYRESRFDVKAVNSSGGVAGFFQWSGWDSTVNGNRWAKASKKALNLEVQLDLMSTELDGSYKSVVDKVASATSSKEAAKNWSYHYEGVSLDDSQSKISDIENWSSVIYDALKSGQTSGTNSGNGGVTSSVIPSGYSLSKKMNTSSYVATSYPKGQCTWFVYNRAKELGINFDPYMGNGGDWKKKAGYQTTQTAKQYSAVCFSPGQAGADSTYGHIAFVEQVKSDGSILISESNAVGLGVISYRTFDKATASQFTYVIGK